MIKISNIRIFIMIIIITLILPVVLYAYHYLFFISINKVKPELVNPKLKLLNFITHYTIHKR